MKNKINLYAFIAVVGLSVMACATIMGEKAPAIDSSPPQANILFEDDFSKESTADWDKYTDEDGMTDYSNGQYRILINVDSFFYWANPRLSFSDVVVEVDATRVGGEGDENQFGLICRHQDINNWYTLVIGSDGWAAIRKRLDGGELEFLAQTDPGVSGINQGNAVNHLKAECIGDRLTLYVNGKKVVEAIDNAFASGDVGLLAGTFDATSVDVLFDNFVVSKP
ncbi:MAG: hypothetical protein OEY93_09680 [Anaerolineae bacterium]|nr:hypothetical protein [Anaerolineae bacterium]